MNIVELQKMTCRKHRSAYVRSPDDLKVGVAENLHQGVVPINGFRHPPAGDTTGWFIYAGEEFSYDPGFFLPLHVGHLDQWCPGVRKYLGLAPGWRFLVADGYEDVWFDADLLNI